MKFKKRKYILKLICIILYQVSRYRIKQMRLREVKMSGNQTSQWQTMRPNPDATRLGDCYVPDTVLGTGGTKMSKTYSVPVRNGEKEKGWKRQKVSNQLQGNVMTLC